MRSLIVLAALIIKNIRSSGRKVYFVDAALHLVVIVGAIYRSRRRRRRCWLRHPRCCQIWPLQICSAI